MCVCVVTICNIRLIIYAVRNALASYCIQLSCVNCIAVIIISVTIIIIIIITATIVRQLFRFTSVCLSGLNCINRLAYCCLTAICHLVR